MAYITVPEFRAWAGIQPHTGSDTLHDLIIAVAEDAVNDYTGRTFTTAGSSETRIFYGGAAYIMIDDATDVTLVEESVDQVTWSTVDATSWVVTPPNGTPKTTVILDYKALQWVRVTATYGYGSTPAQVKLATLMKAAKLNKRRDTVTGVEGFGEFGVVRISKIEDPDIVSLLDPLVRMDRVAGIA